MVGEALEIENLRALAFHFVEKAGLSAASEAAEDDELRLGGGDRGLHVFHEVFTPSFVAALDGATPPADGAEDDGHGIGAEITAPAVDERGKGPGVICQGGGEMMVDVLCDQSRAEAAGFVRVFGIEFADLVPLLVTENGEIDGAWNVILLKLGGRADVDDIREVRESERRRDALGKIHEVRLSPRRQG